MLSEMLPSSPAMKKLSLLPTIVASLVTAKLWRAILSSDSMESSESTKIDTFFCPSLSSIT